MNKKQKILIVDDRKENLVALKKVLKDLDAEFIEATNGNDALKASLEHYFALAILDVLMPGMNGYELASLMHGDEKTRYLPVIFLTAMTPDEIHLFEGYRSGAVVDYILKPYIPEIMISKVRVFLELAMNREELKQHRDHLEILVDQRTNELNQLVIELKRVNRIRTVLSSVNQSIVRIRERKLLMKEICRIANEIGGFIPVIIRMVHARTLLIPEEHVGIGPQEVDKLTIDLKNPSQKKLPAAVAFLTNRPQISYTLTTFAAAPELVSWLMKFHVKTHGSFPINIEGSPVGVMSFCSDQEDFFSEDEIALLNELVTDVSFALQYMEDDKKRKKAEEALLEAKLKAEENDRLKTAFLNNLSHEIRTPMNGIIGFSDLLKEAGLSGEDRDEFIKIIKRESHNLLRVITDIVDISRIETGQIESYEGKTPVNQLLETLFKQYKPVALEKALDISFHNGLDDNHSVILTDESKLKQVLEKLISNAIKFTNRGSVKFGYERKGKDLEFFIEDTGIGIQEEKQADIFSRFTQADTSISSVYGGTGLGLSIAKAFVEICHGKIWLKSAPGKGTTFYFTIPYKPVKPVKVMEAPDATDRHEPDLSGKPILVVEDEMDNFEYINIVLQKLNLQVIHAENGTKAVDLFRNHPEIKLVLMDIKLPDISGFETTREIKKLRRDVPVIALTAYADSSHKTLALESGCVDLIAKPIRQEVLKQKVKQYMSPD